MNLHDSTLPANSFPTSAIFTALTDLLASRSSEVEAWLEAAFKETPPAFYNSVDLRHSGYKLAPVDTNMFPAGFNNLSEHGKERAAAAVNYFLAHYYPNTKRILLIPEDHTRNLKYLDSLAVLGDIFTLCNLEYRFGSLNKTEPHTLESASGRSITIDPLLRDGTMLGTKDDFIPDLVVLNNDFTTGPSPWLESIRQPLTPPMERGWYRRRKTQHFEAYNKVTSQFSEQFGIDPWLLSTQFHQCGQIDFKERVGIECVALGVDKLIYSLRSKYQEYGIPTEPFVFIKAEQGTYGMGIMTARSGEEVIEMNKKLRNQMDVIKGRTENRAVIIQEGIPTIDTIQGKTAEPLLYLVGGKAVDCFYRIHPEKDESSNLNTTGMYFMTAAEVGTKNLCPIYSLVARLAALAAARE